MSPSMTRWRRTFWLLTLALFVGGCSTARTAAWPGDAVPEHGKALPVVRVGDTAVVRLHDGTKLHGPVVAVGDQSLTLRIAERGPVDVVAIEAPVHTYERAIERSAIRQLEAKRINGPLTMLAAAVVVTLVAVGIALATMDLDFGGIAVTG